MSMKTTRKAVVNNYPNIRSADYCDLQALLRNHNPLCHTEGIYGWNFDVYSVYGLTICTGYRNMPGKRLEGIDYYEEIAAAIWSDYDNYKGVGGFEKQQSEVEELLKEFCKLNGGNNYE